MLESRANRVSAADDCGNGVEGRVKWVNGFVFGEGRSHVHF